MSNTNANKSLLCSTEIRIGVLELGSRSVRFMVADFDCRSNFVAVKTSSKVHDMNIESITTSEVNRLISMMNGFYDSFPDFKCDHILVYGTEIARRIYQEFPKLLPKYLRVLSETEEAKASWAAGFMCIRDRAAARQVTVIDQGAGSAEVISGYWDGRDIVNIETDSFDLGNTTVMKRFLRSERDFLTQMRREIAKISGQLERHENKSRNGDLFLLGSVATKIGWLKVRGGVDDFYKPHMVNNASLSVTEMENLFVTLNKVFKQSPERVRSFVDSRSGSKDEALRVLSSSLVLVLMVRKMGYEKFRVSGYGIRHGMAFLIQNGIRI